ncbi:Uncharacterised protein [Candidatus Tiddalikarchaeum anstoanum]|nr:Uncharacterised protein [Candidatus Tiddalikarchaeum anstoanum]
MTDKIIGIVFFDSITNLLTMPEYHDVITDIIITCSNVNYANGMRVLYPSDKKGVLTCLLGTNYSTAELKPLNDVTKKLLNPKGRIYTTQFGFYISHKTDWKTLEQAYIDYVFENKENPLIKNSEDKLFLSVWMYNKIESMKKVKNLEIELKKKEERDRIASIKAPVRKGYKFEDYIQRVEDSHNITDFEQKVIDDEPEIFEEEIEESKPKNNRFCGTNYDSFVQKLSTKKNVERDY